MPADEKRRREDSRLDRARRVTARGKRSLALALAACALLLVALAAAGLGAPPSAQGRALIPQVAVPTTNTPSATASSTSTPTATPTPGTISLVSPSYGTGPVGAHVTVSGAGFSPGSVTLKAASHSDCSSSQATLTTVAPSGGSFTQTFIWPSSLPNGTYYICGNGTTTGPSYQQLATSAPAISLSAQTAPQESQLVISGSNFDGLSAGSSIQLSAEQGKVQTAISPSGVVDANGQFSVPWTVDLSITGTVVIVAQSPAEGSAPPVLQASASVNIVPPATATPSATASTSPTVATGVSTSTTTNSGGGSTGLVLLIVLLLVVLLVGGGALTYVLLRRRGASGPQAPYPPAGGGYPGYPGYPGYSPSPYGTSSPGWDAPTRDMGGVWPSGQYGPGGGGYGGGMGTGGYGAAGGYGGGGVGAVSQWGEAPAEEYGDEPSASWQPRPMTGYGDFTLPQETPQGDDGGGYAPTDPWGNTGGGYGNTGGGDGNYGGYGGYGSRDDGGWRNQANQAGGPGTTRPGGGGAQQPRYPQQPQQGQGQGYGPGQGYGQATGRGWPDEAPGGGGPPPDGWRQ